MRPEGEIGVRLRPLLLAFGLWLLTSDICFWSSDTTGGKSLDRNTDP
jgi:hypothetical protein